MKEVRFRVKDNTILFAESPAQLRQDYPFVGFSVPREEFRYMIMQESPTEIRAVRPNGEWASFSEGTFYVFDTQKELLIWMAEGRE